MPVSIAMRKFGKVLPLPDVVSPPDADVVVPLPLLLPPHAAAISESPTAKEAAVTSHFHGCLRVKVATSSAGFGRNAAEQSDRLVRDRALLLTFPRRSG